MRLSGPIKPPPPRNKLHGPRNFRRQRDGVAVSEQRARLERQQLIQLRKRMLIHGKRRWKEKETALAQREKELTAREGRLQHGAEKVAGDHAALVEERLRLNGEMELGRRQLREQWQELGLAQQQWEACLNQEHDRARETRLAIWNASDGALEEAERMWSERERSARLMLADLHRESTGLEARIGNLREKLVQQETAVEGLQALQPNASGSGRDSLGRRDASGDDRIWIGRTYSNAWPAGWPTSAPTCWNNGKPCSASRRSGALNVSKRWPDWKRPAGRCRNKSIVC